MKEETKSKGYVFFVDYNFLLVDGWNEIAVLWQWALDNVRNKKTRIGKINGFFEGIYTGLDGLYNTIKYFKNDDFSDFLKFFSKYNGVKPDYDKKSVLDKLLPFPIKPELMPNVREFLEHVNKVGKVNILSNGIKEFFEPYLEKKGIKHMFDNIYANSIKAAKEGKIELKNVEAKREFIKELYPSQDLSRVVYIGDKRDRKVIEYVAKHGGKAFMLSKKEGEEIIYKWHNDIGDHKKTFYYIKSLKNVFEHL